MYVKASTDIRTKGIVLREDTSPPDSYWVRWNRMKSEET